MEEKFLIPPTSSDGAIELYLSLRAFILKNSCRLLYSDTFGKLTNNICDLVETYDYKIGLGAMLMVRGYVALKYWGFVD